MAGSCRRQDDRLQEVESKLEPIPFGASAARSYELVVAAVAGKARRPRKRFADLLIAATAHASQLDLYTRNVDDFAGLEHPFASSRSDRWWIGERVTHRPFQAHPKWWPAEYVNRRPEVALIIRNMTPSTIMNLSKPRRPVSQSDWGRTFKLAATMVAFLFPPTLGYICLSLAVDYYGPSARVCTTGRGARNCNDSNKIGAQLQALFTGSADHAIVGPTWLLWMSRIALLITALYVVIAIAWWVCSKVVLSRRRKRLRM